MQTKSLAEVYSSKTDDELIALTVDPDALAAEARPVLAEELRRRNITVTNPTPPEATTGHKNTQDGKLLRVQAEFVLNLAIAIFGTAIVESSVWRVWSLIGRTNSISGIQAREWFLSLTIAALLGFFIGRRWLTTAIWVWTLPTALFGLGTLLYSARPNGSVFGAGFAEHFVAPNCLANRLDCRDFFVFTIPGARTIAYSLGARISTLLQSPTN